MIIHWLLWPSIRQESSWQLLQTRFVFLFVVDELYVKFFFMKQGTVIRVHDVSIGQLLYEFRRGFARCVSIYSLSFSSDSVFLCASSNTETVHIFKLEDPKDK